MSSNLRTSALAFMTLFAISAQATEGVVAVSASAPGTVVAGKAFTITVKFNIREGYHIYGPTKIETGLPTTVSVTGPKGFKVAHVNFPATHPFKALGETVPVLSGAPIVKVSVSAPKKSKGKQLFTVNVSSQACNDRTCERPQSVALKVLVNVK